MRSPRLLPVLLVLLLLAGCDTGDVSSFQPCNNSLSGFVTAAVDGAPFEADCRTASLAAGTLTVTGSAVTEGPGGGTRRTITLVVTDFAEGPFAVGSGAAVTYEVTDPGSGGTRRYVGESGEVVVEQAFRENPSGTFAFTARDGDATVTVTEGRFDLYE